MVLAAAKSWLDLAASTSTPTTAACCSSLAGAVAAAGVIVCGVVCGKWGWGGWLEARSGNFKVRMPST